MVLPQAVTSFELSVSPIDAKTAVISASNAGYATHDQGGSWSPIPLPATQNGAFSGLSIDGAGTLFTLRGGVLFSLQSY